MGHLGWHRNGNLTFLVHSDNIRGHDHRVTESKAKAGSFGVDFSRLKQNSI